MKQDFTERMLALEGVISSASSGDWFALREFLGFERQYNYLSRFHIPIRAKPWSLIPSLSAKNKAFLGNLLLGYRTVDIAATLECHPELPLRYERMSDFGSGVQVEFFTLFSNSAPSEHLAAFR